MRHLIVFAIVGLLAVTSAIAQEEVNIYSSRHYDSDDALFDLFTEQTGIEVNLLEGKADELLARIKREGDLSPADLLVTVDVGRLQLGVNAGVFTPIESSTLNERIPQSLRHPDGLWFGLSKRVRCIYLSKEVPQDYVTSYAQLSDPTYQGEVLIRSSSNIYNQSLLAWLIGKQGVEATQAWANGVVNNMARTPQGGDTDQLRALAAGEGKIAVGNHYYFARMIDGSKASDNEAAEKIRIVFPNQNEGGAHINLSGAGVIKTAPNKENAIKFLEFLTTVQAQELWVSGSYEYPVVANAKPLPVVQAFGAFEADDLDATVLGENNRQAVRVMDRAAWR